MGRIVAQTKVTNPRADMSIECGMFVDTGAGALILPSTWKDRLGDFEHMEPVELQLANGDVVQGEVRAPARIKIEGFRPVYNEVIFLGIGQDAADENNAEPLLGYVVLEQAQAAVDMLGHRLAPVRCIDLK